jgi:hypothetical protein
MDVQAHENAVSLRKERSSSKAADEKCHDAMLWFVIEGDMSSIMPSLWRDGHSLGGNLLVSLPVPQTSSERQQLL